MSEKVNRHAATITGHVNINQAAILKLVGPLSFEQAALLHYLLQFAGKAERLTYQGEVYHWFAIRKIAKDLPMLGTISKQGKYKGKLVTSKRKVHRLLMQLAEAKVVEPHPDNQKLGRAYYHIAARAWRILDATVSNIYYEDEAVLVRHPMTEVSHPPMTEVSHPYDRSVTPPYDTSVTPPMTHLSHNSTLIDSKLKDSRLCINEGSSFQDSLRVIIAEVYPELFCLRAPTSDWWESKVLELGGKAAPKSKPTEKRELGLDIAKSVIQKIALYAKEKPNYLKKRTVFTGVFNKFARGLKIRSAAHKEALRLWHEVGEDNGVQSKLDAAKEKKVVAMCFEKMRDAWNKEGEPSEEQLLNAFELFLKSLPKKRLASATQFNPHFIHADFSAILADIKAGRKNGKAKKKTFHERAMKKDRNGYLTI